MDDGMKLRPFTLLGHRVIRSIFNESAAADGSTLELIITPSAPVIAGTHKEQQVIELEITIVIARTGTVDPADVRTHDMFDLVNTVLGVTVEAGYVARDEAHDGDLFEFAKMVPIATEQLFAAARRAAIMLAMDSGFDASNIPTELFQSRFAEHGLVDDSPAASKTAKKKAATKKSAAKKSVAKKTSA
jgi:hypothetical protein